MLQDLVLVPTDTGRAPRRVVRLKLNSSTLKDTLYGHKKSVTKIQIAAQALKYIWDKGTSLLPAYMNSYGAV